MSQLEPEEITEIIDQRRPPTSWVKYAALGVVGMAFVICGYRLMLHFTPRELADAVSTPMEKGAALTGKFLQHIGDFLTASRASTQTELTVGRVTATDKSGPLIVAKQDLALSFTDVDEHLLGTSTAEVRAVAKAFYYVPLLGPGADWQIETQEKNGVRVCVVHAPQLRVLMPVNLDTRSIEIRTDTGALRSNSAEMTEAAVASITPKLNRAALDQLPAVRGAARKTVAAFVQSWLLNSDSWGSQKVNAIQVLFPGETAVDTDFTIPGFYDHK